MTRIKQFALVLFVAGLASLGFAQGGQNAITQTTLAAAVTGPSFYSGTTPTEQTAVSLASVSGISAPTLPGTPVSVIYVDREAMGVFAVNSSTNVVIVKRGYLGTYESPHRSGDMVLVAPAYNSANGGNPVPSGFYNVDPPFGGSCTALVVPTSLWLNVLTGAQWLCSTVTNTWVPGFNNQMAGIGQPVTAAVVAATTITPSGPFFHLTGATVVTTIATPVGCNATAVGGCTFSVISDTGTASQLSTGGNLSIAAAITTVTGKIYTFVWDAANSKWAVLGS